MSLLTVTLFRNCTVILCQIYMYVFRESVLLSLGYYFENSVDPDQLASGKPAETILKYMLKQVNRYFGKQ